MHNILVINSKDVEFLKFNYKILVNCHTEDDRQSAVLFLLF